MATSELNFKKLAANIRQWALELGFSAAGVTGIDLKKDAEHLSKWLESERHGEMKYMEKHAGLRSNPSKLFPGVKRIISVRMDYLSKDEKLFAPLNDPHQAYISRYALGRDYHKLMRKRLQNLAEKITQTTGPFGYRAFTDSAPILEKALARNAGLGWIGKHTNLINKSTGSWFFLGELFTNLPLPIDSPTENHCGSCSTCIDICPTAAITAPYELDAKRCISYLTIELRGSIPIELRPLIGNRIFGCDDCQLFCPWNKFAQFSSEDSFNPRHGLDSTQLIELFFWSKEEWLSKTEGSAIRRIGFECWLRNIAVALGNATTTKAVISSLQARSNYESELVREHVEWALEQHTK
ncbi:MAG: tRNA epoxyqueuosine(34) reductase QueG [Pseudomonadota bacterium]|nr:tRNA epoxyqueuosine(34) reductase QueG [Pseudomonadota bacterium]